MEKYLLQVGQSPSTVQNVDLTAQRLFSEANQSCQRGLVEEFSVYTSNVLAFGSLGAEVGTIAPGPGNLIGAVAGGAIGFGLAETNLKARKNSCEYYKLHDLILDQGK